MEAPSSKASRKAWLLQTRTSMSIQLIPDFKQPHVRAAVDCQVRGILSWPKVKSMCVAALMRQCHTLPCCRAADFSTAAACPALLRGALFLGQCWMGPMQTVLISTAKHQGCQVGLLLHHQLFLQTTWWTKFAHYKRVHSAFQQVLFQPSSCHVLIHRRRHASLQHCTVFLHARVESWQPFLHRKFRMPKADEQNNPWHPRSTEVSARSTASYEPHAVALIDNLARRLTKLINHWEVSASCS